MITRINRNDLAKFIPDHGTIVAFERLFDAVEALDGRVSEVENLRARMETLESLVEALTSEVENLKGRVETLESLVEALTEEVWYFPLQFVVPTVINGGTVNIPSSTAENPKTLFVLLKPSNALDSLTINFPATPRADQDVVLRSNHLIENVSLQSNSPVEISFPSSSLSANMAVRYKYYNADQTWYSW